MRELKFRAWDKVTKRYWNVDGLSFDKGKLVEVYLENYPTSFEGNEDCKKPDEVVLEQYTGLKDKNDKEICEGDIVATVYKTKCRTDEDVFGEGHDEWDEKINGKFEVKYSRRATFGISYIKDPVVIRDLWELGNDIKVIGNIHENPELLEGE